MENKNELIYDNGEIKLNHLTLVQYRNKSNNRIMDGIVVGQESTHFIIWNHENVTIKIDTNDILQISVIVGNEEKFLTLNEYREMQKLNL